MKKKKNKKKKNSANKFKFVSDLIGEKCQNLQPYQRWEGGSVHKNFLRNLCQGKVFFWHCMSPQGEFFVKLMFFVCLVWLLLVYKQSISLKNHFRASKLLVKRDLNFKAVIVKLTTIQVSNFLEHHTMQYYGQTNNSSKDICVISRTHVFWTMKHYKMKHIQFNFH